MTQRVSDERLEEYIRDCEYDRGEGPFDLSKALDLRDARAERDAAIRNTDEWKSLHDLHKREVDRLVEALTAERDALNAEVADLKERVHYAEGTAELAMKHRDVAEAALATARAEGRREGLEMAEALLRLEGLHYGASVVRRALANPTEDAG